MTEDNPVYYPIRTKPARRAMTFRCERCGRVDVLRRCVPHDPRNLCRACAEVMHARLATMLANMRDERLYPVPDDGDGEYDDPRRNITTVPHV